MEGVIEDAVLKEGCFLRVFLNSPFFFLFFFLVTPMAFESSQARDANLCHSSDPVHSSEP